MSERDLKECGDPEGDSCVVNYSGYREYWCKHADQDTIRKNPVWVTVYCNKLKRRIRVVCLS